MKEQVGQRARQVRIVAEAPKGFGRLPVDDDDLHGSFDSLLPYGRPLVMNVKTSKRKRIY
ncbi:hypothetical protein M513_06856 [Trichuris suis]|uniref:Uncharacterized protein n=1 Tax=Trichuris suis TaxID=68888 RepID=A0A085M4Z7_9BILA|nr:hypothetical protein M513_06856 [Trichuris suis]